MSERNGGSFNVYRFPLDNPKEIQPVTSFKTNPVRFLSMGNDGTLCYTYDGEIYTQPVDGKPKKVAVSLVRDDEELPVSYSFTRGASEAVVSPDGKQVAFIVRGEVFVTSVEYGTTKQVTHTPEAERGLSFGADNRSLVYSSERNGKRDLYIAKISRKDFSGTYLPRTGSAGGDFFLYFSGHFLCGGCLSGKSKGTEESFEFCTLYRPVPATVLFYRNGMLAGMSHKISFLFQQIFFQSGAFVKGPAVNQVVNLRIGINVLHFNKHTFLPAAENTVVLIDEIQGIQVQPV